MIYWNVFYCHAGLLTQFEQSVCKKSTSHEYCCDNSQKREQYNTITSTTRRNNIFLPSLQEFELLQSWGLTETDLAQATFSAARASFCSDQDRKEMMKELRKVFGIEDKVELEIFINHKCGQPDDPRKVLKTSF